MTTQKVSTAVIAAKLPPPEKDDPASLATATENLIPVVMACPDFANQAVVQTIVKTLQTDNLTLVNLVGQVENAKAAVPPLEAKRNAAAAAVKRDRHNLAGTLTAICAGVPTAITAWGAQPATATTSAPTAAAPTGVSVVPVKAAPGTLLCKCKAIRGAKAYLWALTSDPAAAPTSVQPILTTGAKAELPGQTVGHVVYLRVAVLRARSGQSAWSDAVQVTVR